jgi:Bacterial protein of unknown function (DUF899)
MPAQWTWTRQRYLGMNTHPIRVATGLGEAARQQMLAKEKAHMRARGARAAERRRMLWMAVESQLQNFQPGSLPDQTDAGKAPGDRVGAASADTPADTRAGEMAEAGRGVAHEFEGPNRKVSPTTVENHWHALSRFLIAFCSGVAAALAWWSYGDAARQMIASSHPRALPRALTAPDAPDMIVPDLNQLDVMLREPATLRQSLDRAVADQELTRNTDQTATSVDQAPSVQADSIPVESRGDAPSLQPTVSLKIKPTEAKALQTLSEKGKQLSGANQHDASCFPSASAVLQNYPGGRPSWTMRAPGHEGIQCWYAAAATQGKRPSTQGQRPTIELR